MCKPRDHRSCLSLLAFSCMNLNSSTVSTLSSRLLLLARPVLAVKPNYLRMHGRKDGAQLPVDPAANRPAQDDLALTRGEIYMPPV